MGQAPAGIGPSSLGCTWLSSAIQFAGAKGLAWALRGESTVVNVASPRTPIGLCHASRGSWAARGPCFEAIEATVDAWR